MTRNQIMIDTFPTQGYHVAGVGSVPSDFVIIGTNPSTSASVNTPFGKRSLNFLEKAIRELDPDGERGLEDFYFTHIIKRSTGRPPGKPILKADLAEYMPATMAELKAVAPKRILAIDTGAARALCPGFTNMVADHGSIFYNPELDAYVVPTFHLSIINRKPSYTRFVYRDIERWLTLPDPVKPRWTVWSGDDWVGFTGEPVIFDIETNESLDPYDDAGYITRIGFKDLGHDDDGLVWIVPNPTLDTLYKMRQALINAGSTLVTHNGSFDAFYLTVKTGEFWGDLLGDDTMLLAHADGEVIKSLKHLTTLLTDRPGPHAFGDVYSYDYLAEDILSTEALYYHYLDHRVNEVYAYHSIMMPLVRDSVGMRWIGVHIDRNRLIEVNKEYVRRTQALEEELLEYSDGKHINWNSTKQVADFLIGAGVKLTKRTPTGKYSVDESVLLSLADDHEVAAKLLEYRSTEKDLGFLTDYLERTTDQDPFLHPRLKIHGTRTGRLSCADPNLQQVPRVGPIKTFFTSRFEGGFIGLVDLSQAELRVVALLSGDAAFARMLLTSDAHRAVAATLFSKPEEEVTAAERKKSKGMSFGLLYQGTIEGLAYRMGVGVDEASEVQRIYFDKFPGLKNWISQQKRMVADPRVVYNSFGRKRDLVPLLLDKGVTDAERKAVNSPVQGDASDITLSIFAYVLQETRRRGLSSRPVIGIHDSVYYDIHPDEVKEMAEITQDAFLNLSNTPIAQHELFKTVPFVGELIIADTWAGTESTNEYYDPKFIIDASSHHRPEIDWSDTSSHYDAQ